MKSSDRTMQNLQMERRHFQFIADVLRELKPERESELPQWEEAVGYFARCLRSTNSKFRSDQFVRACGMEEEN